MTISNHFIFDKITCVLVTFYGRRTFWCLLRSSENAFIMQSKSTFLGFLYVYSSLQIGPPLPKIIQGLWPRFHFIGLALTHIPMRKLKTLPSCRLREVGSICEARATRPVKKTGPYTYIRKRKRSPNVDWDCMGGPAVRRLLLSGCEMTQMARFCYMTRSIIPALCSRSQLRNTLAFIS